MAMTASIETSATGIWIQLIAAIRHFADDDEPRRHSFSP